MQPFPLSWLCKPYCCSSWRGLHIQHVQNPLTPSLLCQHQQSITWTPSVKWNLQHIFRYCTITSCTMLKIKCLICWNTVRITTLRIRLTQLSLPNHYMLNRIGEFAQVRLFINIHFKPTKGKKNNTYSTSGLCKLQPDALQRRWCYRVGQSPVLYHLPAYFRAVPPATDCLGSGEFGC